MRASSSVLVLPAEQLSGSIYVIGDVHGEYDALATLVESLPLTAEDTVVQIGDCINRGPRSFEVVEFWLRFDRCRRFVLAGNHEDMFLGYLWAANSSVLSFGGEETLRSYRRHGWTAAAGDPRSLPDAHFEFYRLAFPWTGRLLQTPDYLFAHAGYDLARTPHEQSAEMLSWGSVVGADRRCSPQIVVRGHFPYPEVMFSDEGWIGLDTGCGIGGYLSCLRLPDRQVFTHRPASYQPHWWRA